ncbi:hypothetical protein JYT32_00890 [Dehalococcoides mccartyi]|nr:hypothetical protein [Dehalococcoides mccartyi]
MKIFLLSQSSSIGLFHSLGQSLREKGHAQDIGYYVSEEKYYRQFLQKVPDFEEQSVEVIKSWELLRAASASNPDSKLLERWESKLNGEVLWDALISDRRITYGDRFDVKLDYAPEFTHAGALSYLGQCLAAFDGVFARFQPDLVVGFVCSTLGEYVAFLVARSRGIPYLNLRPTRVENFMGVGTTPSEPSDIVAAQFAHYTSGRRDEWWDRSVSYLRTARDSGAKYEGVIGPSRKTAASSTNPSRLFGISKLVNLRKIMGSEIKGRRTAPVGDRGTPGMLLPALYKRVFNPLRARRVHRMLKNKYVSPSDFKNQRFAFFPLHMEPEITLLIYSRSYLNQIEVVRNVAYNLPVGMKLVVKEHPVVLGKRNPGYYRKLLQIMNVEIADPAYTASDFIEGCSLVANIAGSVGFEAAISQKPVITFGRTPYEFLPGSMVKRVTDLSELGAQINQLLENYQHDETALTAYVAAVMSTSIPVNWYTNLLGRRAYSKQDNSYQHDIDVLAEGLVKTYADWLAN